MAGDAKLQPVIIGKLKAAALHWWRLENRAAPTQATP